MWTITDPKSSRTQCDAGVPSRPIGLVRSSRSGRDDPVRDGVELALRPARADDEVVGDGRERRQVEQHDVGRLLVLRELDDASGELERGALGLGRGSASPREAVGARAGRLGGLRGGGRGRLGRRRSPPASSRVSSSRVPSSRMACACAAWPEARGRSRSVIPPCRVDRAHGRRYRRRPHPGRGSAATGPPPPASGAPRRRSAGAARRGRSLGRSSPRSGPSRNAGPASGKPSRGTTMSRARATMRSGSCQRGSSRNVSAERISDRSAVAGSAARAARVSAVYDGPGRSSSIRLATNAGLPATPARPSRTGRRPR